MIAHRVLSVRAAVLALFLVTTCSGEADSGPLAGAGLFEGELQVYGAPCGGDALRSIAVVTAERSQGEPETLWKVSDPTPDMDAYTFLVRESAPDNYRLDVAPELPLPSDQELSVLVETTASTGSVDFVLSDLNQAVATTNYGDQPAGFGFLSDLSRSVQAGEGCSLS